MEVSQKKECDKSTGNEGAPKSDPAKKMKQSRLPFHPIDVTSQKAGQGTKKKRKLTGDETPSPKLPKVQKTKDSIEKIPSLDLEGDHEVSSSCEAENVPLPCPMKPTILDRFIKKSPHEEITSTIEVVDLTAAEEEPTQRSEVSSSKDQQDKKAGESDPTNAQKGSSADLCSEVDESPYSSVSKKDVGETGGEPSDEGKPAVTDGQADEAQDTSMEISAEENTASESEADKSKLNDSSEMMDTSATSVRDTSDGETPSKRPRTSRAAASSSKKASPASGTSKPRSKLSEEKMKKKQLERQQLKEKREKEMQEKKEKKQQEKEERLRKREEEKAAKEKAKQEAKEKKEKERQERKEQAERERLEKLQQKEEEKKKKQELLDAKAEEKRKKEEEKRQKEEEKHKEEEEEAKQKAMQIKTFKSYFVEVKPAPPKQATEKANGTFKPFQLLEGMLLHPTRRPALTKEEQNVLDGGLQDQAFQCLYLEELRKGKAGKGRSTRTLPRLSQDDDVELLGHDSEVVKKVTHHVKFLKFHTNYRPPYYGTWNKKSRFISPRNPFKKDEQKLDYEVDSDEEWEEEEPGESLSSSESEPERDEDDEDDEEDGWMVPHGYLSEGEGCEDDEEVSPEVLRARRAAKLEAWEAELKQKCKPVRAVVHGCYWEQEDCTIPQESFTFLEQFQTVCLWKLPISTLPRAEEAGEAGGDKPCGTPGSSKGPLKKSVPEEAMPDLVRLVHGNEVGIKRLIKEFRMYWRKKTKPTNASPETGVEPMDVDGAEAKPAPGTPSAAECPTTPCTAEVDEEGGEQKDEFSMSKRQLEIRINEIAVREKRPQCKRTCWYVHADVLERYDCSNLALPNQWQYVSEVRKERQAAAAAAAEDASSGNKTPTSACAEMEEDVDPEGTPPSSKALPKDQRSIMDFARRLEQSALMKSMEEGNAPKEAGKNDPKDAPPAAAAAAAAAEAADVGNKTPGKALPKDQLSIMSFAKPAGELNKSANATREKRDQGSTLRSVKTTSPGKKDEGKTAIEPIFIE